MQTKRLVNIALLLTFAVVIHTVESVIPVPLPVPGAKLGLANIITLLALYFYGLGSGMTVAILRSILGSIFAGQFLGYGFFFSLAGGILSTLVMAGFLYLEKRNKVSLISVSIVGAVSHNTAQVVTAAFLIGNYYLISMYLPLLLVLALPTGFFTGLAALYLRQALQRVIPETGSAGAGQEV